MKMFQSAFKLILCTGVFLACGCNSSKKAAMDQNKVPVDNNMRANLLDGAWEANYIMSTPKPFADLYANAKPTVTFNSTTGQVSGMSGCNNFTGTFSMDGNKLKFAEGMALTRKMCPDMTGENVFMETLKKVNTYSVTEQGKTLNLIMGDIAVMRFARK
jgi:heat shock protein HslJ